MVIEVVNVADDGNCMFAAVFQQMSHNGYQTMSPKELRCTTADYMEQHSADTNYLSLLMLIIITVMILSQ